MTKTRRAKIPTTIALAILLSAGLSIAQAATYEDKLREANDLHEKAVNLYRIGGYDLAIPLLEKALRLRTETLGEKHPDTLTSLNNLAQTYDTLDRPAEALPLQERVLQLFTETLGEKHPKTLTSLNNLAGTYVVLGRYIEALPLQEKALRLQTEVLGEKHVNVLASLNNLAYTYAALGRTVDALPLQERVLQLFTKTLGEKHPKTLTSLNNLATIYVALGRHAEALALQEKTLRLQTEALGEKHPDTLTSLNNLAQTYASLGRHAEALPLQEKALRFRTEILGEKHPDTFQSLNNLGQLNSALGRHAEALALQEKALRLQTEALGEKHPDTLKSLHNIAWIYYRNLGRHTEALALQEKVLKLRTEVLGEKHPDTLVSLNNLAQVYAILGHRAKALPLQEKALRLFTETLGEKHPTTLLSLNNLADTYSALGYKEKARALFEKTLRFQTETLGEKHPDTLVSLNNLGWLYRNLGRHTEALVLLEKAAKRYTEVLGEKHPDTLMILGNLAVTYSDLGRHTESLPLLERVVTGIEQLRSNEGLSSANRQALFVQWVRAYKYYAQLQVEQGNARRGFDLAELSKARTLLESTATRRANESGILSPDEREQVRVFENRLSLLDEKIAAAFNQSETKLNLETNKNQLVREYAELRRQLAAKYPKYAQLNDVKILTAEEGKALIPADTVLISYLIGRDRLLAFTLSAKDGLQAYVLDKTPGLDKTIEAYRQMVSDLLGAKGLAQDGLTISKLPNRTFVVVATGKTKPASRIQDAEDIGRVLTEKLLKPIFPAIAGYRHWIISPDGALSMLPFETLPVEARPVIANHDVSYVQSLSMYALLKEREEEYRNLEGRKAILAMGGAIYDDSEQSAENRGNKLRRNRMPATVDVSSMLARSQDDASSVERAFTTLGLKWPNLPGTETEVSRVAEVFADSVPIKLTGLINKVTNLLGIEITPYSAVYKGEHATEAKLQELNRQGALTKYRYLLFSAHGYLSTYEPSLSALVLGQVNKAPGTDGFVTASEWPAYDLKSDLIVLSACDTGVGKVVQGEGVMGLPYALYVAGNKNTMLSLWPVVDESTSLFMTHFFERLKSGLPQAQALGETKREFLNHPKFNKPTFWAPFVMYGS